MASHMVGTRKRSNHIESARDHVSGVRPDQPSMRTRQAQGSVNDEGRGIFIWSLRASVSPKAEPNRNACACVLVTELRHDKKTYVLRAHERSNAVY